MRNLFLIVLAVGFIGLMSCEQIDLQNDITDTSQIELRNCQLNLRNTEGLYHNNIIKEFYKDYNWCYSNQTSFFSNYKAVLIQNSARYAPIINMSESNFDSLVMDIDFSYINQNLVIANSTTNDLIDFVQNNPNISGDLSNAVVSVLNYVDNYDFITNHVNGFKEDLCLFIQNNPTSLNNNDQFAFDVFLDVLIYSNKLWSEESVGGLGYASKFQVLNNTNCSNLSNAQLRWSWGNFFEIDGIAALSIVCIGGWQTTVGTGGAAAPVVAGTAIIAGAAASTIYAAGSE